MSYTIENIRNVALVGHQGSGKTTLAEALNYVANGMAKAKGEVEKKNTISDYQLEEKNHQNSFSTSLVPVVWKNTKINFLDVPGSDEFLFEGINSLRVVDAAILVIDASSGVQVGTQKNWIQLREHNIPTIILVTKMDKDNIQFDKVIDDVHELISKKAVVFTYPTSAGPNFNGFVNALNNQEYTFVNGKANLADVSANFQDKCEELQMQITEEAASSDEELMEKFFMEEPLTAEELHNGIQKGLISGEVVPVVVACGTKNVGVSSLLDMIVDIVPNPTLKGVQNGVDKNGNKVSRKPELNESFSAYVFKTIVDPFAGIINVFKVLSGSLKAGAEIAISNATTSTTKVSQIFTLSGNAQTVVDEITVGDIAAVSKINDLSVGMTISDSRNFIAYDKTALPTPIVYVAINPKDKKDDDKISQTLQKISLEDPTLEIKRNVETSQLLLGGQGSNHIGYIIEKMKNTYKLEVIQSEQKIVYRETIKGKAQAEGRYIKQSGGSGYYGVVVMSFEPSGTEENIFTEQIFGGSVPKNYHPSVEKGFFEAMEHGLLAGFPVIGVKTILLDGKYHPVDSNELAFKMAAKLAYNDSYPKANPTILEPIMKVVVTCKPEQVGTIMGDFNQRRGRVSRMDMLPNGLQEVEAIVPEAEITSYAIDLKGMTQGFGSFTREFVQYEEVPKMLHKSIIDAYKQE